MLCNIQNSTKKVKFDKLRYLLIFLLSLNSVQAKVSKSLEEKTATVSKTVPVIATQFNQQIILDKNETTNPIAFNDYGYTIGNYQVKLKFLLDLIVQTADQNPGKPLEKTSLSKTPFFLKEWKGLAPHPFSEPQTDCLEITIPITADYFVPYKGSVPFATVLKSVEAQEIAKVTQLMKKKNFKMSVEDQEVATMIANKQSFGDRGIVRIIFNRSCTDYCLSLYHNYNVGSDNRCNFAPASGTLQFWTVKTK